MTSVEENNKRPRGRPRKESSQEIINEKRPRGRPRKPKPPPKKRGRKLGTRLVFVRKHDNQKPNKLIPTHKYRELIEIECKYKLLLDKYPEIVNNIDSKDVIKYIDYDDLISEHSGCIG